MRAIAAATIVYLCASTARAAGSGAMTQAEADHVDARERVALAGAERHVILMPVVGIWSHPFKQSGWTAKPGPVGGLDVKIEPFRWLGVRASFLLGKQPVESEPGALNSGYSSYQPTLGVTQLELRAEPTLELTDTLSGYIGIGLFWGRIVAPEAVTTPPLHTFDRSAVHLGYEGALGIAWEPRADRVVLDLSVAGALLDKQTGSAYENVQAFSDAGHRTTVGGLSQFSGTFRVMFGIGFVL